MKEWMIRNLLYILIGGMYTQMRKKFLLRVGIICNFLVLMGRTLFGK